MKPSKFIEHHERRLRRSLTAKELGAIEAARVACTTGKRDTVKAMTAALSAAA